MWEEALAANVEALARGEGLEFRRLEVALEPGEPYVEIDGPHGETFFLEPLEFSGRTVPASVWLFSYPTMRRVRLVGPDIAGEWQIKSSDGVPFHRALDALAFGELTIDLRERVA